MTDQNKLISHVNLKVPTELYIEYKIALLQRYPRRNVTQDLITYMRSVVEENKKFTGNNK